MFADENTPHKPLLPFGNIPPLVATNALPPLSEKYRAREGVDALAHAFDGKIAVHPGLSGGTVATTDIPALMGTLLDKPRQGKSTAYIHVPFCHTHCLYCGFYTKAYRRDESLIYTKALQAELALWQGRKAVDSSPVHALYLGGGTPTALEAEDLLAILQAARRTLPLANDCEITVEGRLSHFDKSKIEACLEGGANRFSLGVQSFHTDIRQALGRLGSREEMLRQLELLLSYNQAAVIVDLIYGLPGHDMGRWQEDLAIMRSLNLDGVDCYQLNLYKNTPLGKAVEAGKIAPPADVPLRAAMYAAAVDELDKAFYRRLSLSHWGRTPRERNLYNLYVKSDAHCLAFGPGGGGNLAGNFYINDHNWKAWLDSLQKGEKPITMMQRPHARHRFFRAIATHMEQGWLNIPLLEQEFSLPMTQLCRPLLQQWERAGLLELRHDSVMLTLAGQFWQGNLSQLLLDYLNKNLERGSDAAA